MHHRVHVAVVVALVAALASLANASTASAALPITKFNVSTTVGAVRGAPDGSVWFVEPTGIGRRAADGSVTHVSIAGMNQVHQLTAAPNGDLWFSKGTPD